MTTTPRNVEVLKAILKNPSTVITHAPTEANRAYLAESFLAEVQARYGGTRLGRQELEGVLVEDVEGALWTPAMLERGAGGRRRRGCSRIVVAVDPPVTATKRSDECGIVVVGADTRGRSAGLARGGAGGCQSVQGASPEGWARAALAAMERHGADRLVAEVNQGGDLVERRDPADRSAGAVPRGACDAGRKMLRAEPVAALYEQGRVAHLRGPAALEEQMCQMTVTGWQGQGSPDRVDALVWALTELMVDPAGKVGATQRAVGLAVSQAIWDSCRQDGPCGRQVRPAGRARAVCPSGMKERRDGVRFSAKAPRGAMAGAGTQGQRRGPGGRLGQCRAGGLEPARHGLADADAGFRATRSGFARSS